MEDVRSLGRMASCCFEWVKQGFERVYYRRLTSDILLDCVCNTFDHDDCANLD